MLNSSKCRTEGADQSSDQTSNEMGSRMNPCNSGADADAALASSPSSLIRYVYMLD